MDFLFIMSKLCIFSVDKAIENKSNICQGVCLFAHNVSEITNKIYGAIGGLVYFYICVLVYLYILLHMGFPRFQKGYLVHLVEGELL